jgi:guanylate kinase
MRHEMLEVAGYRDWRYGTAIDSLDMNKTNVGVFNRKGIESLMNRDDIDLFVVMMIADGKTRLLRSLNREEFPDVNEIIRRYQADEKEWDNFHNFHFIISNEG